MVLYELPAEILLQILSYIDIPELLSLSRTNHLLRDLSLDPILHTQRKKAASTRVYQSLTQRPSLSSLLPPSSTIYLSTTHVLARNLSRQLVSIRLNRNLSRRPSASSLVKSNILPEECCKCDRATGEVTWGGGPVAPGIVGVKRRVERERIKDGLRAWLEKKARRVGVEDEMQREADEAGRISVRRLVQKFTSQWKGNGNGGGSRWGEKRRGVNTRVEPPRAHVYSLRKFWEGLAMGQQVKV